MGKQKYWLLYADEHTGFKKSFFLHTKDEQVEVLVDWFNELESKYSINVRYIHCNNVGENEALQQQLNREGSKIPFEFTAPDTPQQNSVVEHAFPMLMGCIMAMMIYAGFSKSMWQLMWCKVVNTATALGGITVPGHKNKCSYEVFYGKPPYYTENL